MPDAVQTEKRSHQPREMPNNVRNSFQQINDGNRRDIGDSYTSVDHLDAAVRKIATALTKLAKENPELAVTLNAALDDIAHARRLNMGMGARNRALREAGILTIVMEYAAADEVLMELNREERQRAQQG